MARRDEGAYSQEICNRGATKPATPPRRKTDRAIFKTLLTHLKQLEKLAPAQRLKQRYQRFRSHGQVIEGQSATA
jgi:acetyl-CoA carboxylase alpha subunit